MAFHAMLTGGLPTRLKCFNPSVNNLRGFITISDQFEASPTPLTIRQLPLNITTCLQTPLEKAQFSHMAVRAT